MIISKSPKRVHVAGRTQLNVIVVLSGRLAVVGERVSVLGRQTGFSRVQVLLQPSLLFVLPSSHCSHGLTIQSPQRGGVFWTITGLGQSIDWFGKSRLMRVISHV